MSCEELSGSLVLWDWSIIFLSKLNMEESGGIIWECLERASIWNRVYIDYLELKREI